MRKLLAVVASTVCVVVADQGRASAAWPRQGGGGTTVAESQAARQGPQTLDLNQCLDLALRNSSRGKVATSAVEVARAVEGQARSSWWPEVSARILGTRLDQDPDFIFPASGVAVPASSLPTPPMTITLPPNAFGPGFPPVAVPLTIPGSSMAIPAQVIPIPQQTIELMDRNVLSGSFKVVYPLYTGGLRGGRIAQARAGIEAAREDQRRTALEIVYDVKRAYYGVVLARRLGEISRDTLARMEATLELTENMYKTGSGRVKKTDYLRHKSMVETIRSVVAEVESQERSARAALQVAMEWEGAAGIEVTDRELPYFPGDPDVGAMIQKAHAANPEIARVRAGIRAAEAGVSVARSGHLPKAGLFASANLIGNSYDMGMVTPTNKTAWSVGVGVDIPIFQGFRVVNEEREARASLQKLQQQLSLLQQGISLEVQRTCHELMKTQQQQQSSRDAYQAATENRELNVRAYQDELVETKDVIEAQLTEALLAAQHYKVLHDRVQAQARLETLVGEARR